MTDALVFRFSGNPRGQGRPRATARGGFASVYKDPKSRTYEASIAKAAKAMMGERRPLEGPLSVSMRFRMPIPKSATKRARLAMAAGEIAHTAKPDTSNMTKAVEDALNGVAFIDDSQIVRSFCTKVYSDKPGVDVRVEPFAPQGDE